MTQPVSVLPKSLWCQILQPSYLSCNPEVTKDSSLLHMLHKTCLSDQRASIYTPEEITQGFSLLKGMSRQQDSLSFLKKTHCMNINTMGLNSFTTFNIRHLPSSSKSKMLQRKELEWKQQSRNWEESNSPILFGKATHRMCTTQAHTHTHTNEHAGQRGSKKYFLNFNYKNLQQKKHI